MSQLVFMVRVFSRMLVDSAHPLFNIYTHIYTYIRPFVYREQGFGIRAFRV
jgi:hypothetical protein